MNVTQSPVLFDEIVNEIKGKLQNDFPKVNIYGLASDYRIEGKVKPLIYRKDYDYYSLLPGDDIGEKGYAFFKLGETIEPTHDYWIASNLQTKLSIYFWVNLRTLYPELNHLPEQEFIRDILLFFRNINLTTGTIKLVDIKTNESAFEEYKLEMEKMYPYNAMKINFTIEKRMPCNES